MGEATAIAVELVVTPAATCSPCSMRRGADLREERRGSCGDSCLLPSCCAMCCSTSSNATQLAACRRPISAASAQLGALAPWSERRSCPAGRGGSRVVLLRSPTAWAQGDTLTRRQCTTASKCWAHRTCSLAGNRCLTGSYCMQRKGEAGPFSVVVEGRPA